MKRRSFFLLLIFFPVFCSTNSMNEINNNEINHLGNETSQYLLQHADNPVNWYPWGDKAFQLAESLDKPIFLSIGYSTCHWCHVMEEESFEDEDVAKLMNEIFVCIKVDREERPDIDNIYMNAAMILNKSGGWPLNIFMTPDKKPFFAATYIPKYSNYGRKGMLDLLPEIKDIWINKREDVEIASDQIIEILNNSNENIESGIITSLEITKAYSNLLKGYDEIYGGFGTSPKFPMTNNLLFLLRYFYEESDLKALEMVENTLILMRNGGIYDQIGFGFHRYSTDNKWIVPHFEKMLYNQALLTFVYTECFQLTKNNKYKKVVDEILEFIKRDMTSDNNVFYSAIDADTEDGEGYFYTWTINELQKFLNNNEISIVKEIWGITVDGNFSMENNEKRNILFNNSLDNVHSNIEELSFEEIRLKILLERDKRNKPLTDDKIMTDWNGLMIAALAKAGRVFKRDDYIERAEKAIAFFQDNMIYNNYSLYHYYRNEEGHISGYIDDYVFMIWGLLELYEATYNSEYLLMADSFSLKIYSEFFDTLSGGYFFNSSNSENLIIREKQYYDGAIPSGNSVHLSNLYRLWSLTGKIEYKKQVEKLINSVPGSIQTNPSAFTMLLTSYLYSISNSIEIVICTDKDDIKEILDYLNEIYNPYITIIVKKPEDELLNIVAPFTVELNMIDEKTTIYVCKNFTCEQPIFSKDDLIKAINR